MLAPRASEGNGQVALALANVVGDKVDQEVGNPLNEFNRLWERLNVLRDLWMASRQVPELGNVVGIWKEADIEHQVAIGRNAVPVSKARACDQQWPRRL